MLPGVERLVDLVGPCVSRGCGISEEGLREAVRERDLQRLGTLGGHFAGAAREGQTVRLARTLGLPLRYFVAKRFNGPFLLVSDRMDRIWEWCCEHQIAWQFDPFYTRMVPVHYLVELQQVGCPDPNPVYHRFHTPEVATGSTSIVELGRSYLERVAAALRTWLSALPADAPIGLAFSGGIDSTSVWLLARRVSQQIGRDPNLVRAFTLDLGQGEDARQARDIAERFGLLSTWEAVTPSRPDLDVPGAIRAIEDYHPLDVACAAAGLSLLSEVRRRHPHLRFFLDGDGGDENLKAYPLEDSDLTISSILKNPMLYQEGWGIDAIKHSLTYSGGLSRSYVRTFAPGQQLGFEGFSPYTVPSVVEAAVAIPFETLAAGDPEKLYSLKGQVVSAGVRAVTGLEMPVRPKRRFQDGAGATRPNLTKQACRQIFVQQWQDRMQQALAREAAPMSGNAVPA